MACVQPISVYTDGSCKPNPGKGGWAWVKICKKKPKTDFNEIKPATNSKFTDTNVEIIEDGSGGKLFTTNNQMELTALIEFLKNNRKGISYIIYVDSEYVLKGLIKDGKKGILIFPNSYTGRLDKWIKIKYKNIKNPELWEELDKYVTLHLKKKSILEFRHVRSHTGDYGNELVDKLAKDARYK